MDILEPKSCGCPGAEEILADLDADLLDMQPGERLWKCYCFHAAGHATGLRHRIYTKRKANGRLALVTFAVHNPLTTGQSDNGNARSMLVRSGIARVPDLSADDLDRVITGVRNQALATADTCEQVDLSAFATLREQVAWLETQDKDS